MRDCCSTLSQPTRLSWAFFTVLTATQLTACASIEAPPALRDASDLDGTEAADGGLLFDRVSSETPDVLNTASDVLDESAQGPTVAQALSLGCSTSSVRGLSQQLIDQIQCANPGTMKSIAGIVGITLSTAVLPYLQTAAADALVAASRMGGGGMTVNSALRALPQQFLLYRWYQLGQCGIALAARPGTSNHESGLAVDLANATAWMNPMTATGFRWFGSADPVHFDFVNGGIDLRGASVLAFQKLWNLNHPNDVLTEDGVYGTQTESRLAQAPAGGFVLSARCM